MWILGFHDDFSCIVSYNKDTLVGHKDMMTYTKLFGSILDSTVWQEALETRVVWITLLAMADRDGVIEASVPGLARRAGVSLEQCEAALERFRSPDKYSRSQEFDGRRIKDKDGGWILLNHAKYRNYLSKDDRKEYWRIKQAEYRARKAKQRRVKAEAEGREGRYEEADSNGDEKGAETILGEGL